MSKQELNDYGLNFFARRSLLCRVHPILIPTAVSNVRVQVDLKLHTALQSKGLSALDVVNALSVQNLILPTGTSKIGSREYDVSIQRSPANDCDLNRIPIKTLGSTTIYIKDVAWVRDGFPHKPIS